MSQGMTEDFEKVLATAANYCAGEGKAREVAILAVSRPRIEQSEYDGWDGGQYGYTVYFEVPSALYGQIAADTSDIEGFLKTLLNQLTPMYPNEGVVKVVLCTELIEDRNWREKSKAWIAGKGITNQGRARSDNVAPRMCDGLLFRSQPEINLYRAMKALGITFAPLPVFIRGGETYRRIEPDFVIIKDGAVVMVELDGDTVHKESPVEAHDRTTILVHEGAYLERVNADECDTLEKARACAHKLLAIIAKLKSNR